MFCKVFGDPHHTLPRVVNLLLQDQQSEILIAHLSQFALSNGSACRTGALEASHVVQALGFSAQQAYGALRVSPGRQTTPSEIQQFVQAFRQELALLAEQGMEVH